MRLKFNYLNLIWLIFCCQFVFAQTPNFVWGKQVIGTSGINPGASNNIMTDASGNIYSAGFFQGTNDFDPSAATFNMTSLGSDDIFIQKLDASGNFLWAKQIGSVALEREGAMCIDGLGNVYTTGFFQGTVDFDPSASTFNLTSFGASDVFISKLDGLGNFVWAEQLGGTAGDQGYGIATDLSNNLYLTGFFSAISDFDPSAASYTIGSLGSTDAFVAKFSSAGNLIWASQLGGPAVEHGWALKVDQSGNVYSTGDFNGVTDFDPSASSFTLSTFGVQDIYVSKLDASGNFLWAKQFGGSALDIPYHLGLDALGNVITTGNFNGIADFDPGASTYSFTSNGSSDIFIDKLDAAGNFVWAKQIGSTGNDGSLSIAIDKNNDVYFTGYYSGTTDFDPGSSVFTITPSCPTEMYIEKLTGAGNFVWVGVIVSNTNSNGCNIHVDSNGNIFTNGRVVGTTDLDPGLGVYTVTTTGVGCMFIHKMCQTPTSSGSLIGAIQLCAGVNSTYSVAPAAFATSYTWSLPGGWSGTSSTNTISVTSGGSGTISVISGNICGTSSMLTLSITVNPNPTITVSNGAICIGQSFTIIPNGASTYTFQGGNAIVSPTVNSSYTVVGTSTAGCVSATSAVCSITVNTLPIVIASTNNSVICGPPFQQIATLTANGASTYTWSPGGTGTSIAVGPSVTATYTVIGTDINGCMNSSVFTQSVSTCAGISAINSSEKEIKLFPNPNNGIFTIQIGLLFENCEAVIINNLEQTLLKKKINSGSNTIKTELADGVYFYHIKMDGKIINKGKIIIEN